MALFPPASAKGSFTDSEFIVSPVFGNTFIEFDATLITVTLIPCTETGSFAPSPVVVTVVNLLIEFVSSWEELCVPLAVAIRLSMAE